MLYTNSRLIVSKPDDVAEVERALSALEEIFGTDKGLKIETVVIEPLGALNAINIEEILTVADVIQALSKIQVAAFGKETVELPGRHYFVFDHSFTEEEMSHLGSSLANNIFEQARVESDKAQAMKEYKARIDGYQEKINEFSDQIRLGRQERTTRDARVILDHSLKIRIYLNENGDVIGQETFKPWDFQRNLFEEPGFAEIVDGGAVKEIPMLLPPETGKKKKTSKKVNGEDRSGEDDFEIDNTEDDLLYAI